MDYKMDLVSIIIPTFNDEKYLLQAIESCYNQSYPHLEIIVVDDGSTNNTRGILQDLIDKKVIKYIYQDNRGVPGARNTGIMNATGEYIQFLDSDDLLDPEKLEKQVDFLKKNRDFFGVYCRAYIFNESNPGYFYESKSKVQIGQIQSKLIKGNIMPVNAPLTRRVGTLFDEKLLASEDWDYWFRLFSEGRMIGFIDEILCYVRRHQTNMSNNRKKILYFDIKVLSKMEFLKDFRGSVNYQKFIRYLRLKLFKEAVISICKAIKNDFKYFFVLLGFPIIIFLKLIEKTYDVYLKEKKVKK